MRDIVNDLRFNIEEVKTQKSKNCITTDSRKSKFAKKSQNQTKKPERPASVESDDGSSNRILEYGTRKQKQKNSKWNLS